MVSLIKKVFIVLLSFRSPLDTKCLSSNDEPCMVRPSLIDFNPVELKYYTFMVILDKCSVSWDTKYISCGFKCKFNSTTCNSNQKWNKKTY